MFINESKLEEKRKKIAHFLYIIIKFKRKDI